jgi:hypothetical protein
MVPDREAEKQAKKWLWDLEWSTTWEASSVAGDFIFCP